MTRTTIYLPDELTEALKPFRDQINVSQVCATALQEELDRLQRGETVPLRSQSNANIQISITPSEEGSQIEVHMVWFTKRPLSLDNVAAFLNELDMLGVEHIVTEPSKE